MPNPRPWYREPESFIAVAALLVSLTTAALGGYEAYLQRAHDRAEVWPHLEIATYTKPTGAVIYLDNTGIGPGIVEQFVVSVDGRPMQNWPAVVEQLSGKAPGPFTNVTVRNHGMRPGDRIALADVPSAALTKDFWESAKRVSMTLCYRSVFNERWTLTVPQLGQELVWTNEK